MTEKKTQTKESDASSGWSALMLQGVFASIQGFVTGTLENLKSGTEAFARNLVKRIVLFILFLWSLFFILVGGARILDDFYGRPGMGEIVVGAVIFLLVLLIYIFDRNNSNN